jgi:hypothetical protein
MTLQATRIGPPEQGSAKPAARPLWGGLGAGLVASLCCGGSLLFASIGLGAFYGSLGLARYVPQALAVGTLVIVGINYWYYRRKAARLLAADPACDCGSVRQAMLWSGFAGLGMMAASFIFLTWLEHGFVRAAQFLSRPEYGQALIPGVRNEQLVYVALTFLGVPLLGLLPLPRSSAARPADPVLTSREVS